METQELGTQTIYRQFREDLYAENLRGAWEFESMVYGIMARLGLSEDDALELACAILLSKRVSGLK
jgi:hypothetical protein